MEDLDARSAELASQRAELAAGRTPEPEPPAWRSARDRAGAPLWRLVDFASHCPAAERDGIEAGLLASGLLDAWVSPDGAVTLPDGMADALIDPSGPVVPWESLPDDVRDLDRNIVRTLPRTVAKAGFQIVRVVPND